MDFEKVNLELIEALLEWIVDGRHSYPPGNCLLSSLTRQMAEGQGACLRRPQALGTSSLPGALALPAFYPSCVSSCLLGFWGEILPFEVHPLFSLCTLALTKQKNVNNTVPKGKS